MASWIKYFQEDDQLNNSFWIWFFNILLPFWVLRSRSFDTSAPCVTDPSRRPPVSQESFRTPFYGPNLDFHLQWGFRYQEDFSLDFECKIYSPKSEFLSIYTSVEPLKNDRALFRESVSALLRIRRITARVFRRGELSHFPSYEIRWVEITNSKLIPTERVYLIDLFSHISSNFFFRIVTM